MQMRTEHDSMGQVQVPAQHLWGAQTQRSLNNFSIGQERMPVEIIRALTLLKKACALANASFGKLTDQQAGAIADACDAILAGEYPAEFPLHVWQTGSGTQTNMNVNEVIASIMMNYIGMYLVNWTVKSSKPLFNNLRNESRNVAATANIPKMGLDKIFPGSSVNEGIIIAIIVVILIYLLLNKTTFGYELKAVGFNRDASKYAGINEKKSIIMSMMIAGAIAGLAGGLLYLAGTGKHIEIKDVLASEGFTGISVALLGLSNPIGVLFSGIFIAYLTAGGFYLQLFEFSTEIIDIIVAVIIYFSAFALMVKMLIGKVQKARHEKEEAQTKGGGDA